MKIKVQLIDKQYTFKRYSQFQELVDIFCSIEPQFNLESFTYYDEEQDLITILNEEDYKCFLNSSISIIQATGQYNCKQLQLESERNQSLIQNFPQKVQEFKDKLRYNLQDQKTYYEYYLQMTCTIQKIPIEQQPLEQEKKLILIKIEEQKKRIEQNKKLLRMKTDLVHHFLRSDICSIVNQDDKKMTYDQITEEEFNNILESVEIYLADQFLQVYLQRYNKLIVNRKKQLNEYKKLIELKNNLKQIEYQIKRRMEELRQRETQFLYGIYAIKSLQRKL